MIADGTGAVKERAPFAPLRLRGHFCAGIKHEDAKTQKAYETRTAGRLFSVFFR
jgi:hypothetical protein